MSAAMPGDLLRPQPHHRVVVVGVVGDGAGDVGLLEPADPVLETSGAGDGPRPGERLGIAAVRLERLAVRLGEARRDVRQVAHVGDEPGLGAVRQVGVGEEVDGGAVLERDARCLDRRVEALRRSRRRDDRDGALAVAPEEHHQQVGLLGLRRHPRRGAGALDVEDQERELERDRQPDGLGLEDDARPGRRRDAERAAERGADSGADRGDLVLGLERDDAELLPARKLLEDRRRRRDRVGAEEERQPRELRSGDQPVGDARCFP